MTIVPPAGSPAVLLKDYGDDPQSVFDDETMPGNSPLSDLNGLQASGTWTLRVQADPQSNQGFEVDLDRWETRLHLLSAPQCVP